MLSEEILAPLLNRTPVSKNCRQQDSSWSRQTSVLSIARSQRFIAKHRLWEVEAPAETFFSNYA